MKKMMIIATIMLWAFASPHVLAEDTPSGMSMMIQKIDELSAKMEKLADGQKDILKQLSDLREELHVVKIRVTHR